MKNITFKKLFIFFVVKKLFLLLFILLLGACATTQKEQTPKETGFVLTQEMLEEYFEPLDPQEFGACTRCGILNKD